MFFHKKYDTNTSDKIRMVETTISYLEYERKDITKMCRRLEKMKLNNKDENFVSDSLDYSILVLKNFLKDLKGGRSIDE